MKIAPHSPVAATDAPARHLLLRGADDLRAVMRDAALVTSPGAGAAQGLWSALAAGASALVDGAQAARALVPHKPELVARTHGHARELLALAERYGAEAGTTPDRELALPERQRLGTLVKSAIIGATILATWLD